MRGLRHINLNVSDLDRSERFYAQAFDLVVVDRSADDGIEKYGRVQRVEQVLLASRESRDLIALSRWEQAPIGPGGLDHIGFVLDSDTELAALLARVVAAGGSVGRNGERMVHGCRERFAYLRDPDGYAIELSTQAGIYSLLDRR
jgi:catechol 2,3-dioxygenase-like lactoylglutathione lyase family enzyme